MAHSAIRRWRRWRSSNANTFLLELFHGPTLAFKDLAMQFLARLMDHALEQRGERATIVVATSGDTGGAAVEAFRGRSRIDLFVLFPQGRISDVQRRMMTTAEDDNVHALAIEGNVRRLPGHGERHVQSSCLSATACACRASTRSTGRASSRRWSIISPLRSALGAPARKVAFTVPTGNFGDILRAMSPSAWACRSTGS